ncbi:hypothetical protein [Paraburkholderia sp. J76]|uniref:hypothetical protein n=1 Tax=Paraburkholderia sp. J76 TaxID=2805439 RepID=UPI002ABE343E|nr:hypothetical protein [Paraburkholderia sp. J76]
MTALLAKVSIFLVFCAVVGFLLGRLIRGRQPAIERARPRIAISGTYLRDAHDKSLSPHTRMRCAFEATYFCLSEVAEENGIVVGRAHPNVELVRVGLSVLNASNEECRTVELLARWAAATTPSMPEVSVKDACKMAARIHDETVSRLSAAPAR